MQPVFAPLGFDWQLTVGVLTSFLAREVFVSTMSVLRRARPGPTSTTGVIARIRGMTRDDGRPVFTPATAAAALVFFVLAMQCLPTLAVTRRETGSVKYAALQLGYMSGLAYVAALVALPGVARRGSGRDGPRCLVQDAVVTIVALWAGWIVFRRVAGFVRPKGAKPGCANCPTATVARRAAGRRASARLHQVAPPLAATVGA